MLSANTVPSDKTILVEIVHARHLLFLKQVVIERSGQDPQSMCFVLSVPRKPWCLPI